MKLYLKLLFLLAVLAVVSLTLMNSVDKSLQAGKSVQLEAENSKRVSIDNGVKSYRLTTFDFNQPDL